MSGDYLTSGFERLGRTWERLLRSRESWLVLLLALLIIGTASVNARFLGAQNIKDLMLNVSLIALLAIGQSVPIIMRQIDLSVGSIVGITAFLSGLIFSYHPNTPSLVVFVAATGVGFLLGAVNAALIIWGRVPSLIATLGTLYIYRGADYAWVHGRQINAANVPTSFLALGNIGSLGVPLLMWIVVLFLVLTGTVLRQLPMGRECYAIGSNPAAAVLAGINVQRRTAVGFLFSGAIAGLTGVLWLARFGTVDATAGLGIEFQVVTAAVVGGVAITGGSGTVVGAALGALLLGVFNSSLVVLRVPPFWQQAFQGTMLLIAISVDAYLAHRLAIRLRIKRSRV
jgi:rhamnose transport system permease protein